tara:strand:+ start:77 stop:217 length:141 start_codon:yes stop_codon:yes gene_type:complete
MQNTKQIEKTFLKEQKVISLIETSKLLANFFNGVIVEIEEEYVYES